MSARSSRLSIVSGVHTLPGRSFANCASATAAFGSCMLGTPSSTSAKSCVCFGDIISTCTPRVWHWCRSASPYVPVGSITTRGSSLLACSPSITRRNASVCRGCSNRRIRSTSPAAVASAATNFDFATSTDTMHPTVSSCTMASTSNFSTSTEPYVRFLFIRGDLQQGGPCALLRHPGTFLRRPAPPRLPPLPLGARGPPARRPLERSRRTPPPPRRAGGQRAQPRASPPRPSPPRFWRAEGQGAPPYGSTSLLPHGAACYG